MRFGIEFGSYSAKMSGPDACQDVRRRAVAAYRNNFEALFVAQHYANGPELALLQSIPLLAYLAGQVPGMYLGTSIFLLPLHPPVMVAEDTATLDNLSGGKFLFGVGQGYRDREFSSFGIEKKHRRARLVEGLEVIRKLWTEDDVSFNGRFFQLDHVTIEPKPLQRPRPPILMGADTVQTVARVPEVADHWISSRRHSKAFLHETVPEYKKALAQQGREFKGLFIFRDLCLAETSREAENRVRAAYERRYQGFQKEGQPGERYDLPFDELKQGRLVVGSPEEVIEDVMSYHNEFGAEFMWFMVDWPGFEPQWALETIELFGKRVIPEIKRLTPECPVP